MFSVPLINTPESGYFRRGGGPIPSKKEKKSNSVDLFANKPDYVKLSCS